MSQDNLCPVCQKLLELKQINLTTAIYLCVDLKCPYPVGYDCIEVERNILEVSKVPLKKKNEVKVVLEKVLSNDEINTSTEKSDKIENVSNSDLDLDFDFTIGNIGDNTAEMQDIDTFLLDLLD